MRRLSQLSVGVLLAVLLISVAGAFGASAQGDTVTGEASKLSNQANEPPTAAFTVSPEAPEPGDPVTLNGSASTDPDGEIVKYRWDLDGDGQTDTTGGPNARVAFPSAGVYDVTLTVVDDAGATDSLTKEIIVEGDIPPTARLAISASTVTVGDPVTFNATGSSDPDGQIERWALDLNGNGTVDRTFTNPPIFRTNYEEPGTYEVTLEVTDNDGRTATTTVELVVEEITPETVTRTVTVTQTTTSTLGTDLPDEPDSDGGAGVLDRFPGGGLGLAIGVVVLFLAIGGGFLYATGSSSGGTRGSRSRGRQAQSDRGPATGIILAMVVTLVLIGVPVAVLGGRNGAQPVASAEIAVGFMQSAGLVVLALMLFLFVWFQLPAQLSGRGEASVGPLSAAGFRLLGTGLVFIALVLVVVALAGLLISLNLSTVLTIAGTLLVGAIGLSALALAVATVSLAMA